MHPFLMPNSFESQKPPTTKKLDLAGGCNLPSKKKTALTPLGIILDHLGSPPVSGPYTAAIGTMCYQFQGDTPGEINGNPPRESTGWLDNKNEHKGFWDIFIISTAGCFNCVVHQKLLQNGKKNGGPESRRC